MSTQECAESQSQTNALSDPVPFIKISRVKQGQNNYLLYCFAGVLTAHLKRTGKEVFILLKILS